MGKRKEIDPKYKVWLVEECLAGRMRGREAARRAGVGSTTMQRWISLYQAEGAEGLSRNGNKRKQKYSGEIKQRAVEDYLSGKGSLLTIARQYGIRADTLLQRWIMEYTCHGEFTRKDGENVMARRNYTPEERLQAVRAHLEDGKSISELAAEYELNENSVRNWVRKYQTMGISGLEDRRGQRAARQTPRTPEEELRIRNAQLEHENDLLRMENDLLKKLKELERGKD